MKPYAADFLPSGDGFPTIEVVWTHSHAGVLRGMHFQTPPHASRKFMWCTAGSLLEVVVDLRCSSPTFRQHVSVELSPTGDCAIHIPPGCAHGFLAREEGTTVCYLLDQPFSPSADGGLRWDSFGFDWGIESPSLSARDQALPRIDELPDLFS